MLSFLSSGPSEVSCRGVKGCSTRLAVCRTRASSRNLGSAFMASDWRQHERNGLAGWAQNDQARTTSKEAAAGGKSRRRTSSRRRTTSRRIRTTSGSKTRTTTGDDDRTGQADRKGKRYCSFTGTDRHGTKATGDKQLPGRPAQRGSSADGLISTDRLWASRASIGRRPGAGRGRVSSASRHWGHRCSRSRKKTRRVAGGRWSRMSFLIGNHIEEWNAPVPTTPGRRRAHGKYASTHRHTHTRLNSQTWTHGSIHISDTAVVGKSGPAWHSHPWQQWGWHWWWGK